MYSDWFSIPLSTQYLTHISYNFGSIVNDTFYRFFSSGILFLINFLFYIVKIFKKDLFFIILIINNLKKNGIKMVFFDLKTLIYNNKENKLL